MQSSAENLHYVFDIGDHPTVVTCLPIAAESFKLKSGLIVQMDGRKAKFSQLFSGDAVDKVFISREITDTFAFGFEAKSFAKKTLINSTLSIACWQNRKNITACETQFKRFDLLPFQSFYFIERDCINIPACNMSHVSRMMTTCCQRS